MAHFLEHMLFLGSQKYRDENSFHKFISEHGKEMKVVEIDCSIFTQFGVLMIWKGGYSNAATQSDKTYYYYRVSPLALEESLDR